MSKRSPKKKLKQTDILSSFQNSPKKQTIKGTENGETSQAFPDQEMKAHSPETEEKYSKQLQQEMKAHSPETEEKYSKQLQQRAEVQKHSFRFNLDSDGLCFVECDTSMTVLDALQQNETFQMNKNIKDPNKQMVILQGDGSAVKSDFPCCLIKKSDILKITFIKKDFRIETTQTRTLLPRTDLVKFLIKSTGKEKLLKYTIENRELRNIVDYVCVYGFEEESVETALKRDGRFNNKIFQHLSVLSDVDNKVSHKQVNYEMSHSVQHLKNHNFQIIVTGKKRPDCQRKQTNFKTENASAADLKEHDPEQPSTSAVKERVQERDTKSAGPSTTGQATQNASVDSVGLFYADIKIFLQASFQDILKKLNQRKNSKIQKLFQEDYDKGIQCFTEVHKVRQIMKLSNSVCMIAVADSPQGTGFLAFDRFILTNAHVIKDFVIPGTLKLSRPVTAKFNYEFVGSETKICSVKDQIVACGFEPEDRYRFHDFALLELEDTPCNFPELFNFYKHAPHPNRGGIYIVGHPDCGVKKMDPCFIIETEKQLETINKHISENMSCPYGSLQCWPYLLHNRITYDSCMFHGSSGSPVFDEHCYLIGMHSGGFHYKANGMSRSVIEYAYSIQSIMEAIVTQVRTKTDIIKLLSNFESIKVQFNLEKTEDASEANVAIQELEQIEKEEKMEVD